MPRDAANSMRRNTMPEIVGHRELPNLALALAVNTGGTARGHNAPIKFTTL